jgi:hypothetical protein
MGTTTHRLVTWLADRDVKPITGRGFGGGRYYLYEEAELEKVDLTVIVKEERGKKRRERNRPKLFNSEQTAAMLGVSVDEVGKLAEGGLLSPYRSVLGGGGVSKEYFFTPYVISIYRKNPVGPGSDLVSSSVAAGMLGESTESFYEKWVRTGRMRPAPFRATKGKLLYYRSDIRKFAGPKKKS